MAKIRNTLLPFTYFHYPCIISNTDFKYRFLSARAKFDILISVKCHTWQIKFICKTKQVLLTTISFAITIKTVQNVLHCT